MLGRALRAAPRGGLKAGGRPMRSGSSGPPSSFSDTFSVAQNPIASPWVKNSTVNQNVITTGGVATNNAVNSNNDDAYAWVSTSAFQAPSDNYEITATLAEPGFNAMETELLFRVTDTSSTYSCYELLVNGGGYEVVQINGGFGGNFLEFDGVHLSPNTIGSFPVSVSAGDKIRVRVTGTNPVSITCSYSIASVSGGAWTQFLNFTDNSAGKKTSGQPGIGFYAASAGAEGNKGWTDFSVVAV